ncbi:MAG: recombinase RecT [Bacteroidales bacterium]|nr:recombinase RecT [Bacteroidales bacterium]
MAQNNTPATQSKSVANFLDSPKVSEYLKRTLQEKKGEFVSNLITLADNDAMLAQCEPGDLMKAALNATALNLPLNKNLGYAYIIPYKNGKTGKVDPNFQVGYKGLIQLAIRTGSYRFINATEIREGEIERNKITGEIKFHGDKPGKKVIGYLAYLELTNGFTASLYMSENEIEKHAMRFSKMYQSDKRFKSAKSKWSDPDARPKMALKTVLKNLLGTYGLMTTEFAKAFEADSEEADGGYSGRSVEDAEVVQQNEPVPEQPEPEETEKVEI